MARYRAAGSRKSKGGTSNRRAIPCFIVIALGFLIIFVLFYELLKVGK